MYSSEALPAGTAAFVEDLRVLLPDASVDVNDSVMVVRFAGRSAIGWPGGGMPWMVNSRDRTFCVATSSPVELAHAIVDGLLPGALAR